MSRKWRRFQCFCLLFSHQRGIINSGDDMKEYLHGCLEKSALQQLSVLALAHVGDGVYELLVRTRLCSRGLATAKTLHKETVARVRAPAQAIAMEQLLPVLDEEEQALYHRGRNAKVHAIPKGADPKEYHAATALEALFGYLYLSGNTSRLCELFEIICKSVPNF